MKRIIYLVALTLLLTACSPKAASVPNPAPAEPAPVMVAPPDPPAPAPRTYRPLPEVLMRPVTEGGPRRVTFADGDTASQVGAYLLNVETGRGEA